MVDPQNLPRAGTSMTTTWDQVWIARCKTRPSSLDKSLSDRELTFLADSIFAESAWGGTPPEDAAESAFRIRETRWDTRLSDL